MPCDERYRSWAMRQALIPPPPQARAELVRVGGCPARPGFRELQFEAEGTAWAWCFPPAAEPYQGPGVRCLIFRPGPHGLIAEAVTGETGSSHESTSVDLALAADLAMAAVPVFVDRRLIEHTRHDQALPVRASAAPAGATDQQGAG